MIYTWHDRVLSRAGQYLRFRTALRLAIATGIALRVIEYLRARSLWIDESMLAANVALHSARDLIPVPHFEQVAAPLFVWMLRYSVIVFGVNEYALRLVPLIAGCATVPLVWLAARRSIGPRPALIATWLTAITPALLLHSAEAKPYSVDALVAVAIVALTVRAIRAPRARRNWFELAVAGLAGVGLSVAAPFVLAASGGAIAVSGGPRATRYVRRALALGVVWAVAFLALYVLAYRAEPAGSYMRHFWAWAFLSAQPSVAAAARVAWEGLIASFLVRDAPVAGTVIVIAIAVGIVGCARRSWWLAVLLAGPLALALVASFATLYPIGGRTGSVTVPTAAMLAAMGVAVLAKTGVRSRRGVRGPVISALLLFEPAVESVWLAVRARSAEEPRQIVHDFLQHSRPTEPVYVFVRGVPDWIMYTTDWPTADTTRPLRLIRAVSRLGPNSGNAPPRGHRVGSEGDELRFPFRSSVELIGTPTGVEDVALRPPAQAEPDSGWAENEVRRIVIEARPTVWVVLLHHRASATRQLLWALCTAGARVSYASARREAAAYRMEFDGAQDSASCRAATNVDRLTP